MKLRTRLTLTSAVLLVGAATTACGNGNGGSGAPADASEKEFCDSQSSLLKGLMPVDMANPEMPSNEDMAQAVKDWAAEIEEVGTPDNIPDEARAGFEGVVDRAKEVDASDFTMEKLEELGSGGEDASGEVEKQARAFTDYLTETCGNPIDNLEMPEMPDSTG